MKRTLLILLAWAGLFQVGYSQCNTGSEIPPQATCGTDNVPVLINGCILTFFMEYSVINGAVTGSTYEFTITEELVGTHKYVTITDLSNVVLSHGMSPHSWLSTVTGSVRAHWSDDAACNGSFVCHQTSVTCTSCPSSMPIVLVSFSGEVMGRSNKLTWKTASEQNTEMHVIERSADGKNWEMVGEVEAAGFSTEERSYQLFDLNPMMKTYYRLKSVDFDGYTDYSKVISIQRDQVSENRVDVYPNPFNEDLSVSMILALEEAVQIQIFTAEGRLLTTQNFTGVAGSNSFMVQSDQLQSGLYYMTVQYGQELLVQKIVKQ